MNVRRLPSCGALIAALVVTAALLLGCSTAGAAASAAGPGLNASVQQQLSGQGRSTSSSMQNAQPQLRAATTSRQSSGLPQLQQRRPLPPPVVRRPHTTSSRTAEVPPRQLRGTAGSGLSSNGIPNIGSGVSGIGGAGVAPVRIKKHPGLLERAAFGGWLDNQLDDYTFQFFAGDLTIAEADPVAAGVGGAVATGLAASYFADYDYERTTGFATAGPSAKAIGALGGKVIGAYNTKAAGRAQTRGQLQYNFDRVNANSWTASAGTQTTLEGSAGAYLPRSEFSPNLPLTEPPEPPLGLIGRRRRQRRRALLLVVNSAAAGGI